MTTSGNDSPVIQVRALDKSYSFRPILQKISFSAAHGEIISICGPNGAGKTTFLRLLATLARPNAGEISLANLSIPRQATEARKHLGVVFHHPMLYGELTAFENLVFYARLFGMSDYTYRCHEILKMVGLETRREDLVRTFSRGMQQRLSIGRAILHDPQILVLDEPYASLDIEGSHILDKILHESAAAGKTSVLASHDLNQSAAISSRIDIFYKGRIVLSLPEGTYPVEDLPAIYAAVVNPASQPR